MTPTYEDTTNTAQQQQPKSKKKKSPKPLNDKQEFYENERADDHDAEKTSGHNNQFSNQSETSDEEDASHVQNDL